MGALQGIFSLRVGTPLGLAGYSPTNLIDFTPRIEALTYSTIVPSGFEALTATLSREPGASPQPLSERLAQFPFFGHVALFAGVTPVWEGRLVQAKSIGAQVGDLKAEGYGLSATGDGSTPTITIDNGSPHGLLQALKQAIPLFTDSDLEAPYEGSVLDAASSSGTPGQRLLDRIQKLGDANNNPLDWFVWEGRRIRVVARIPPAQPNYAIPEDETVSVTLDVTETAGAVVITYTDQASGAASQTPLISNPDFPYQYGIYRTRTVSAGTLSAAQANQYAATWLALHSQPTYAVQVTRTAARGMEGGIGGEVPAYRVRAGEWVQVGKELPMLPVMRTEVNAATGDVTLNLGALGYDWQQLVAGMRVQLNYFAARTHPHTGMPY